MSRQVRSANRRFWTIDPRAMATITEISPLAPKDGFPSLPTIAGVTFAAGAAGVKYSGRDDVMLAVLEPGSVIAGTFTRSATRAAPVLWCEDHIAAAEGGNKPFAVLVNSGNANAFTGVHGLAAVEATVGAAAAAVGTDPTRVFPASTGVIGEPLPAERITAILGDLAARQDATAADAAARAIMTTDTFAKGAGRVIELGGSRVSIAGFAKGSGMIAPDMATMLVYIFTDAVISRDALQAIVSGATETTFNAITVDSDTSTSDTLIVGATGKAGNAPLTPDGTEHATFAAALTDVMRDLAHLVVRDGEGASKFVEIAVSGAESDRSAQIVGKAIANSPLVKTAIAGEDANWGRVVMAIGKAGEPADRDLITIRFGDILVAENGWVADSYREADGARYMRNEELRIAVDLGLGSGQAVVWTCDLTHGYISINADYRS